MNDFKALLDRCAGRRMAVLGDLGADCYVETHPERLSREAPVMILKYERRRYAPGCAANTAMNLRVLGAEVYPVGVVGDDEAGAAILDAFSHAGISTDGIVRQGRTILKVRLMSADFARPQQQILRVDFDPDDGAAAQIRPELRERAAALSGIEGVVVSDYRYGAASPEVLKALRAASPEALLSIDSRCDLGAYAGIDLATPNDGEAADAVGHPVVTDEEAASAAAELRERLDAAAVLLTRGNRGMVLCDGETHFLPIAGSADIVDPSGAGDTVVATVSLARVAGAGFLEAAMLANVAAGISVMKLGASVVTPSEILGG